ncbi:hypothetical protein [Streptomyces pseudovenezuelae]|uniref:Uncharacterized protein n=1 Tax=Streptomyces pseudovenezuelae TaxID=67350 RepID=A0ABT6LBW5_9ACTN|nr:hypothetical protein [Streptomyces pseudovenezuelae]MDH6213801.1 hypothetical protein [Streptomyces pseudovenezuelae]
MENVPVSRCVLDEAARHHVAVARQLLVETDGLNYEDLNEKDLCRLIGRYEVAIALLTLAVEGDAR